MKLEKEAPAGSAGAVDAYQEKERGKNNNSPASERKQLLAAAAFRRGVDREFLLFECWPLVVRRRSTRT
jgi:hypothetical protein